MAAVQFKDHPVWKDIQDYKTANMVQAQIAFMVYMEFCEDKGWWNVNHHFCEELSMVFLSGHASRNKPREVILPVSMETKLSPARIKKYIEMIKLPEFHTDSIILAICGGDSGIVYYKLTSGLVPPEHPELTEWKKYRREEMPGLKRHHVSEQSAMYIQGKQSKLAKEETREEDNT